MSTGKRYRRGAWLVVLMLLVALPGATHGEGMRDGNWDALRYPERFACEFKTRPDWAGKQWPVYVARVPVVYQEAVVHHDTGAVSYQVLGFGYGDACAMERDPHPEIGGTATGVMVLPGVWQPNVLQVMRSMDGAFADINEKAEGNCADGRGHLDNPYCPRPFRPVPITYSDLYDNDTEYARELCAYPDRQPGSAPTVICPGIPPQLAHRLEEYGYATYIDSNGVTRLMRVLDPPNSWGFWYNAALGTGASDGYESFFARHWSHTILKDIKPPEEAKDLRGGVIRNILEPANMALADATISALTGPPVVRVTVLNSSIRTKLEAGIKWRPAGDWPVAEAWRHHDGWQDAPIVSGPGGRYLPPFADGQPGRAVVEVRLDGARPGQVVELMVNAGLSPSEAVREPDPYHPAYRHAFADNAIRMQVPPMDLAVANLRVPLNVSCPIPSSYPASWQLVNNSTVEVTVRRDVRLTNNAKRKLTLSKLVTLPPGVTPDSEAITVELCADSYRLEVELNPLPADRSERLVAETTYANNQANGTTVIGNRSAPPPPTLGGGGQDHIVVPKDCLSTGDPESDFPCLNYPNLYIPGRH